jgi:hypothetical protein
VRAGEITDELVALSVDRGVDVVHHLAGELRHANAPIEARGAQPQHAAASVRVTLPPEPDVMAPARTLSDDLLEGEVLGPPTRHEVRAHRRGGIGPVEENAARIAQPALQTDAVRLRPSRGAHRVDDVAGGPDDRHVDRVCRDPLGGVGQAGESEILGELRMAPPDRGQHTVCNACVRG